MKANLIKYLWVMTVQVLNSEQATQGLFHSVYFGQKEHQKAKYKEK